MGTRIDLSATARREQTSMPDAGNTSMLNKQLPIKGIKRSLRDCSKRKQTSTPNLGSTAMLYKQLRMEGIKRSLRCCAIKG